MITSPRNPKIAAAVKLHKRAFRDRDQRFLVEGAQVVAEAIAHAPGLETLFYIDEDEPVVGAARAARVPVEAVGEDVMRRLTRTVSPQGLVGVSAFVDVPLGQLPRDMDCVAVLCAGRDPGNAGTVLRSADAAGADAVVFAGTSVDVYNPKTVRASAGSVFHLPIVRCEAASEAVEALRSRGMAVFATAADGELDLYSLDLSGPAAFLFGNEAWGLPGDVAALADARVRIPIWGKAESLNMAAAATLCLFEAARRRRAASTVSAEDVIAGAAHDIRSPLTAVRSFATLLSQRWETMSDQDREEMLAGILHDSESADLILKQLIEAARVAGGRVTVAPERVDLCGLVEEIASRARFDPSNPQVVWRGGSATVTADPTGLRLAVGACVEAATWWGREGPIEVSSLVEGNVAVVEFFRAGAAEPPGGVESLFVPRKPGTGAGSKIGLFVARGIAEAHGGKAEAEVTSQGLRLRLFLPQDRA